MGFLNRFRKNKIQCVETEPGKVYAPVSGRYIPLQQIPDPVFAEGVMGPGCGIEPMEGTLYAPADGVIVSVAVTGHAVGMKLENGAEVLMHIGMDTVKMQGQGFKVLVKENEHVKCGQALVKFELETIKKAGYPTITAFIVTNADEFKEIDLKIEREYSAKEEFGKVE